MIDAYAVVGDPVRLQVWVDAAVGTDPFWASRPVRRADVAREEVDPPA
jgi:hypothetical protein